MPCMMASITSTGVLMDNKSFLSVLRAVFLLSIEPADPQVNTWAQVSSAVLQHGHRGDLP